MYKFALFFVGFRLVSTRPCPGPHPAPVWPDKQDHPAAAGRLLEFEGGSGIAAVSGEIGLAGAMVFGNRSFLLTTC